MMRRSSFKIAPSLFFYMFAFFFVIACGGSNGGGGDNDNSGSMSGGIEYVTSVETDMISTGYYETIDVDSDGNIYLLANDTGYVGSTRRVHVYNNTWEYLGTLKEETLYGGEDITGDDIIVDAFDRIHIYYNEWGDMVHTIYETDGKFVSQFSGDISSSHFAIAQDSEQTHFMIPFSGIGVGEDTRILYVKKVNHDFSALIDELPKSDLIQMLPGSPAETEVTMNDIRISANNLVLVCIDLQDGNDGVLILNNNFQKVAYLGGNWAINDPRAVDIDSQGRIYLSSTYGYTVLVFNDALSQIDSIDESDFPDGLLQGEFLPADIRVKEDQIYILDATNDYIHIFKIGA